MTKETFFPSLPYQEWLWEPLRLWAYGQLFFHKVVDSGSKYKNYHLPSPSTMVRNTSCSTSNYPVHTLWHGLFKCNPFPSCQGERGFQQCYFPIHVHCQGCSLNKPTNPWHNNCMLTVTPFTLPSPTLIAHCAQENQMAGDLQFPTVKRSFIFLNKRNFGW